MNNIKRHFYKNKDYIIDYDNKVVRLSDEFKNKLQEKKLWGRFGYKKIGGSSIGEVLEVNKFASRFNAFCKFAWIGLPMLDRKYVDAGIAIEPKVLEAIEGLTGERVIGYPAEKYNYNYFEGVSEHFGGLPDGFIASKKLLLEIKTTGAKNYERWNTYGVPVSYQKQGLLYTHLMRKKLNDDSINEFSIVATFLEEMDYVEPSTFNIRSRKFKNWNFKYDEAQILDDIKIATEWYDKVTSSGVSPQWDEVKDSDLLEYLEVSNEEEQKILLAKWESMGKYVR